MTLTWARFFDRPFPRTADLTRGRQSGFGESLLLWQVVILDKWSIAIGVQLCQIEVLSNTDLQLDVLNGDGRIWIRRCNEGGSIGGKSAVVR